MGRQGCSPSPKGPFGLLSPDPWNQITPFTPAAFVLWRTTPSHTPDTQGREDGSKIRRTPGWLPLLPYLACSLSPNSVLRSPQPMPSQAHPRPRLWTPAPATLGTLFLNHAPPSPPAVPVTSSALFSWPCPTPLHADIQCLWAPLSLVGVPTLSLHTTESLLLVSLRNTCPP